MNYKVVTWILAFWGLGLVSGPVYGLAEATTEQGTNSQILRAMGLVGSGVRVGIVGGYNVYGNHEAFREVNVYNFTTTGGLNYGAHDTMMAGIIASGGGVYYYQNYIGVAPGVEIYSVCVGDITAALDLLVNTYQCQVIVSGVQWQSDPVGNGYIALLYDSYAYDKNVLFANPAGNRNEAMGITEITSPGDAYNGITTGGLILNDPANQYIYRRVGSISLSGPTKDGRRKPDVAAPSDALFLPSTAPATWSNTTSSGWNGSVGATSWVGPQTAGVAAILLGYAGTTGELYDNRHEVIKAVLVNAAFPNVYDKAGQFTDPANSANTWQVDRGYGRIDAVRAYQTLSAARIIKNTTISQTTGWGFDTLPGNNQHTYTLSLPARHRLTATLTWDRRIRLAQGRSYFANLDLVILAPDGSTVLFSEALNSLNPSDNLEKCDFILPQAGNYLLKVVNKSSNESPSYGLAFEILPPIPADSNLDYIVDLFDLTGLIQDWLETGMGLPGDFFSDGQINFRDYGLLVPSWLTVDLRYHDLP